eukprot:CAMPEP_0170889860 /NCGR_PEP_ID=MMETSP0734-20130129/39626_1 /TAXON_ID=186038 /ORGANISM="Fragilariopsis kerguelensis, Strain L26-C5" /LENGTH=49 /DNA_ID= /DNA_START= /DNA_END= /DNA_ORIENTATION=
MEPPEAESSRVDPRRTGQDGPASPEREDDTVSARTTPRPREASEPADRT